MMRWKLYFLLFSSVFFSIFPGFAKADRLKDKQKDVFKLNRGRIRDSGKFKVEMRTSRQGIEIYLLNSDKKKPLVGNSNVEGTLYVGKREYFLRFQPMPSQKKFFTQWPPTLKLKQNFKKGITVVLLPKRSNVFGSPVIYQLSRLY